MTTIAYKNGVLACDSCWALNDVQQTSLTKLLRLPGGSILGESGANDSRAVHQLLARITSYAKLPLAQEFAALRVPYDGILVFPNLEAVAICISHDDKLGWYADAFKVNRGCAVVGSGGEVALGAMAMGASAAQAVAIACRWDINSRLPVHTLDLKVVKSKPQKKT